MTEVTESFVRELVNKVLEDYQIQDIFIEEDFLTKTATIRVKLITRGRDEGNSCLESLRREISKALGETVPM